MVELSCALDMKLLWVSAIISLGLTTLSLGLGAPGAPKITICPPNERITLVVTLIIDILVVYHQIEPCFGYDTPVGLCYHISEAHGPIHRFRNPWGP